MHGVCRSVLVSFLVMELACGGATGSKPGPSPSSYPMAPGQVGWIVNHAAYTLLQQQGSTAATLASQYFSNTSTYLIVGATTDLSMLPPGCVLTASFTSYVDMQNGIGSLAPQIEAVVYDSENWSFTPANEQQDPARYYQLAAQLAHQQGLKLIAVPATDLVKSIEPSFQGSIYPEFIRLGIPGAAARYADIYEMQAQGSEMNISQFTDFVAQAASQAKTANPHVTVLAGISTNPTGHAVTSDQLFAAVKTTFGSSVSGYWLNIPAASPYCPTCGAPQPQVAVGLLQEMAAYEPWAP